MSVLAEKCALAGSGRVFFSEHAADGAERASTSFEHATFRTERA